MQAADEKLHVPATSFVSCAPLRLCLFGEHQDYLGLPVIALSLQLYCRIHVEPQVHSRVLVLEVPSLQKTVAYNLDDLPAPQKPDNTAEPDFALAAIHEALHDGWTFPYGALCVSTVDDDMPMKAGCSTSSAFCVAWVQVLACLAGHKLSPLSLAQRAYVAEVTHFQSPGGTMDHMTSAIGGILRIGGPDPWRYTSLDVLNERSRGVWILAYSGEPKDTLGHLWRCKTARLALLQKLDNCWDTVSTSLSDDELELLQATRVNRDTEAMAFQKWTKATTGESANDVTSSTSNCCLGRDLGALMMKHHQALRDGLHLSTPRLEAMNAAAMNAGAWGFKVVGSGGGGCGVAWSSVEASMQVSFAIEKAGAIKVWIIRTPSAGAHVLTKLHDGH